MKHKNVSFFSTSPNRQGWVACVLYTVLSSTLILFTLETNASGSQGYDFAKTTRIKSKSGISASLTNLNPYINQWFLLHLRKGTRTRALHIENTSPDNYLRLYGNGLALETPEKSVILECDLWKAHSKENLLFKNLDAHKSPFMPICDRLLILRLDRSSQTKLSTTEWGTALLRKTKYGEAIINAFKPFLVSWKAESSAAVKGEASTTTNYEKGNPKPPTLNIPSNKSATKEHSLGITLKEKPKTIQYGKWYKTFISSHSFVNISTVGHITSEMRNSHRDRTDKLGEVENNKLAYVMAYDLEYLKTDFVLGTTHPTVKKSHLKVPGYRNVNKHIVPIGSVPPYHLKEAIGVFIGGWKSRHGKFYRGPFKGKVYGYLENGVEIQKLETGLATLYTTKSGRTDIIQWPVDQASQLELLKNAVSARQNGVLVVQNGKPNLWVNKRIGNWSGDAKGNLRSLRSGVCIQESDQGRFLLFFALTAATPSTLAKVMMSYHCKNGMGLDMNQYVFMHNVLFTLDQKNQLIVEYLHKEMEYPKGIKYPRYIMDNNERDFFYVSRRQAKPKVTQQEEELKTSEELEAAPQEKPIPLPD